MIKITYNRELNIFDIYSTYESDFHVNFVVSDLNTNLGIEGWWMLFLPNGHQEWKLSDNYYNNPHINGIEVNAFIDGNIVATEIFQWDKVNKNFNFVVDKYQLSFPSWDSLVYNDEYEMKFTENDVVYDLGSNFGVFTMWASHNNVKKIYSFEPTKNNVDCLRKTFMWDKNITIFDKAISDIETEKIFYTYRHSVSNTLTNNNDYDDIITVSCINLENFIQEHNLLHPTIIKCDIEGAEYDFINSLTDDFFNGIHTFIVEFHNNNNDERVLELIKKFLNLQFSIKLCKNINLNNNMGTFIAKK